MAEQKQDLRAAGFKDAFVHMVGLYDRLIPAKSGATAPAATSASAPSAAAP